MVQPIPFWGREWENPFTTFGDGNGIENDIPNFGSGNDETVIHSWHSGGFDDKSKKI